MAKLIVDAISAAAEKISFRSTSNAVMDHLPLQLKGTEEFCKITFNVKKQDLKPPQKRISSSCPKS